MRPTLAQAATFVEDITALMGRLALPVAQPALRVALAVPFFTSGLTKWNGFFSLAPTAQFLFESIFKLHLFGHAYAMPFPDMLARLDAVGEIALPVLLVLGLATRVSALGLLAMTAVIELVVPSGWANFHLPWASMALAIIALGAGPLSLDHLLARLWRKAE